LLTDILIIEMMSKLIFTIQVFLGKIAAWIAPSYQVIPPIDPSLITQNPEEVSHGLNIMLQNIDSRLLNFPQSPFYMI